MAGQTRINGNLIDTGTDPEDIVSISAGDARYPKLDGPNTLSGDLTVDGAINANNALSVAGDITASSGSFTGNLSVILDELNKVVNALPKHVLPPLFAFPGAAAAYSLRYVNAIDTPVVRVRRSSDNSEQDFKPGEIEDGTLTSFVNEQNPLPSTKVADFDSGAAAAYSLRYVSDSYTGPVVRVRRDSDNTEQDFTPAEIEDGSLESFCGSGDGLVTTWYDQSGNSNDATQTTASDQPKIVSAGVLVTENGKAALDFDEDRLDVFTGSDSPQPNTFFISGRISSTDDRNSDFVDTNEFDDSKRHLIDVHPDGNFRLFAGNSFISNITFDQDPVLIYSLFNTNNSEISVNGNLEVGGDVDSDVFNKDFTIGFSTSSRVLIGTIQEFIFYSSDQSSNRESIETDINSYYQIYEGDNEGHVTTWYDQSGNSNDATQTTASDQPRIVTGGVLVTENGKPALDFDGNDILEKSGGVLSTAENVAIFAVVSLENKSGFSATFRTIVAQGGPFGSPTNWAFVWHSGNDEIEFLTNDSTNRLESPLNDNSLNTLFLFTAENTDTNLSAYQNGSFLGSTGSGFFDPADGENFYIGRDGRNSTDRYWDGPISEVIIYPSDQSANRELIETNINNHYGIY